LKWFFDTSVLIPAFLEDHEHHEPSLRAFLKATKQTGCCAAHSLAEMYATLTRLPGRHRLSGDQAVLLFENIRERLTLVILDAEEYYAALQAAAAARIAGGTVYDALLAQCAAKAEAEVLCTWNVKHFQQMSPRIEARVETP